MTPGALRVDARTGARRARLAVRVQIDTVGEHVCCARKHTVVLAAPRGRVLCVRAFGDVEDASEVLPNMLYRASRFDLEAYLRHIQQGIS